MRLFGVMQAPRSAEDEAAAERLMAIANRVKPAGSQDAPGEPDEDISSEAPETEQ